MTQQRIEVVQDFGKPVEEVFACLADHNNLSKIFGIPVKRIRNGESDVNGVGSVRALGFPPLAIEETVVAVVPNEVIEYTITKNGGPVQKHCGRMVFASNGRGSRLAWTITFDSPPVVGTLVGKILRTVFARGLRKLA